MELKIMQKTYDLALYLYPALLHFPRSERHTSVAEIKRTLFDMMRLIVRANKAKKKKELLAELDAELELLRTQVRLVTELGFLPFKKYKIISGYLAEIGKMLGGWIKSCRY